MEKNQLVDMVKRAKNSIESETKASAASSTTHPNRRIALLEQLLLDEQRENRLVDPHIFLSFAGNEGENLIQEVLPALRKLRVPGGGTFKVETGMAIRGKTNVLDHVTSKMAKCCIFFGIMTGEFPLEVRDDEGGTFAPGAWVLLEAGIARGLGLEIVFFVEHGVHGSFWKNAFGHVRQSRFRRSNYRADLALATELVLEHYTNLKALEQ